MKFLFLLLGLLSFNVYANSLRLETSYLDFSRNDIAIPGDKGNMFDTSESNWNQKDNLGVRLYYNHVLSENSSLRFLFAPLKTSFEGDFKNNTNFNGQNFNAGKARVNYKFNSYRVGYHKQWIKNDNFLVNYGFVGKIRDAYIEVEQNSQTSRRSDFGFVPLLHLDVRYFQNEKTSLFLDIDGLASPQGRAFDVGLFVERKFKIIHGFVGYRFVEGGADNDKVKTFSFINLLTLGASYDF